MAPEYLTGIRLKERAAAPAHERLLAEIQAAVAAQADEAKGQSESLRQLAVSIEGMARDLARLVELTKESRSQRGRR